MEMGIQKSISYFPNLDGARTIAALMIGMFHLCSLETENWKINENLFLETFHLVTQTFGNAVHFFFVLSGFLITYKVQDHILHKSEIPPLWFIKRRILRIFPMYYLIVLFGFFLFPLLPFGFPSDHELSYFLTLAPNFSAFITEDKDYFLTALWSIGVEEQFIFLFYLLFCIPKFRSIPWIPIYLGIILFISIIFRTIHVGEEPLLYYHTFSVSSDLAIGGLTSYLVHKIQLQKFIVRLDKSYILLIYLVGTGFLLFSSQLINNVWFVGIQHVLIGAFFAFVLLEQVYAENSFFKADAWQVLKSSAKYSYGFYVFHCIILFYLNRVFDHFDLTSSILGVISYGSLTIVITYVLSRCFYYYFERPFLQWKTRS